MPIAGLDHINIVTDRLEETVAFYCQLLELTRDSLPGAAGAMQGAWLRDANGDAIVHLGGYDEVRHAPDGVVMGVSTGAFNHAAFRARDFDGTLARVKAMGLAHKVNEMNDRDFRQIFVLDPNNVRLELNFHGG